MSNLIKIDGEDESSRKIHKDDSALQAALRGEEEDILARQKHLHDTAPDENAPAPDSVLAANQQHNVQQNVWEKARNFDQKVYYFPEEFNALRQELEENYPTFYESINPEIGLSPAYAMVFNAPAFIGMMNGALDMDIQFDSGAVAQTCKQFLNRLRAMRGVGPL